MCFCSALPPEPLASRVQVTVLQHPQERRRNNRTVDKVLQRCVGSVEVVSGRVLPPLETSEGVVVLYPAPDAEPMTSQGRCSRMIVFDGTWTLCRELYSRNKELLSGCRYVKICPEQLPPECPYHGRLFGVYALRKPPTVDPALLYLSTAEAVALALDLHSPAPDWRYSLAVRTAVKTVSELSLSRATGVVHRPEKPGYIPNLYGLG